MTLYDRMKIVNESSIWIFDRRCFVLRSFDTDRNPQSVSHNLLLKSLVGWNIYGKIPVGMSGQSQKNFLLKSPVGWNIYGKIPVGMSGQSQKKVSCITFTVTGCQVKWFLDPHSTDPPFISQEQKRLLKKQQHPCCGNLELEELGNLSDKCLKMTLWTTPLFKTTPVTPLWKKSECLCKMKSTEVAKIRAPSCSDILPHKMWVFDIFEW